MNSNEPTIEFGAWNCQMTPDIVYLNDWYHSCQITRSNEFNALTINIATPCLNIIKEYLHIGTIVHLKNCLDRLLIQLRKDLESDKSQFKYEISFGEWGGIDYRMLHSSIESNEDLTTTLEDLLIKL